MWRALVVALLVVGIGARAQDSVSSVKVLYEDTTVKFWHGGATKRVFGPTCDKVLTTFKSLKKYTYGTLDQAGSCYRIVITGAADRKREIDWIGNSLALYTKRSSRAMAAGNEKYDIQEWTKYGQTGGLILVFEVANPTTMVVVSIPVLKY